MTTAYNRRERTIARGAAIVLPQAVALDVEPAVELLGVRHDGTPPDHFRERFIQVWGYDTSPRRHARREAGA